MKQIKEVYVIFNPYYKGYYDGYGYFRGILTSKKYIDKEDAFTEIETILTNSNGKTFLKVESYHTYI